MTAKTINIQPNECYGSTTDILQYELYDRVEIEKQKCTKEQNKKCVSDTSPSTLTSTVTAVGRSKKKAKRKAATVMIGLLVFFSLLLGSLLAMILYSPLVRKYWENSTDFSLKIQQLEDQLEVLKQENNKTQEVLNSHATNLYQNCIQDRRSCTMQSGDGSYYWEGCYTEPQLSINQAVSSKSLFIYRLLKYSAKNQFKFNLKAPQTILSNG